eukprot:429984-Pyramimonas_sp.AAC.1
MSLSWPKRSLRELHHVRRMIADIDLGEVLSTIDDPRFCRELGHNPPRPTAPKPVQHRNGVRVAIVVRRLVRGDFHPGLEHRIPAGSSGALSFALG